MSINTINVFYLLITSTYIIFVRYFIYTQTFLNFKRTQPQDNEQQHNITTRMGGAKRNTADMAA